MTWCTNLNIIIVYKSHIEGINFTLHLFYEFILTWIYLVINYPTYWNRSLLSLWTTCRKKKRNFWIRGMNLQLYMHKWITAFGLNLYILHINMHILHTALYTFCKELTRRICNNQELLWLVDHFLYSSDWIMWSRDDIVIMVKIKE